LIRVPAPDRGHKLAFGDSRGNVVVRNWAGDAQSSITRVSDYPIVDLQYVKNYGSPMLFGVSNDGACHCARLEFDHGSASLTKVLSFSLFDAPCTAVSAEFIRCAVAEGPMVLYSYVSAVSAEFIRRDLRADRILHPLRPKAGLARGIHVIEGYRDCLAVIGSQFEFWDLRASFDEPVIAKELDGQPFALRAFDTKRFAIAMTNPQACYLDLDAPDGAQNRLVYETDGIDGIYTQAFAAQPGAMTALAHTRGVNLINLKGQQATLPQKASPEKRLKVSSLLFHESTRTLAFVHDGVWLCAHEISEKRM
jgi:hypothetical protein